jgi:ankyrin repeat protein
MPSHKYYKPELRELSPLMQAIVAPYTRNSQDIFDYLLDKGANVNYATHDGYSVLMITVVEKASRFKTDALYAMAEKLLLRGADQQARNQKGETVMDLALSNDYRQVALLLKQKRFNQ